MLECQLVTSAPVTSWFISTIFKDFSSSQIVEDSSCKKLDPARYHWPPPPGSPYSGYACKPSLHGSGQIVAPRDFKGFKGWVVGVKRSQLYEFGSSCM